MSGRHKADPVQNQELEGIRRRRREREIREEEREEQEREEREEEVFFQTYFRNLYPLPASINELSESQIPSHATIFGSSNDPISLVVQNGNRV
jgi:hypothetical protein